MTQGRLERAVARATGESLQQIRRWGFSIADPPRSDCDREVTVSAPKMVNWDRLEAGRLGLFP